MVCHLGRLQNWKCQNINSLVVLSSILRFELRPHMDGFVTKPKFVLRGNGILGGGGFEATTIFFGVVISLLS